MAATVKELEAQVSKLAPEDRARLAYAILLSLDGVDEGDIEEAWRTEVRARLAAYRRGEIDAVPAAEVFEKARRLLR
ncbi:MAG: addiction module protein [Burkholderiales bacterium]